MATIKGIRRLRRILYYTAGALLALFFFFLVFVDRFVEPILRERLHTLIIKGSDSLYTYELGDLKANFFGGNVDIESLRIRIDSNRYETLRKQNRLPALTMQLDLDKGRVKGISVVALLLGRKIKVEEILSKDADVKLSRHIHPGNDADLHTPLWKSLQPDIDGIYVKRIKFDGVKLLYRNADTSESVKLQFDRCDALFEDVAVDSLSSTDTSRVGFTRDIFMKFHDLKFRTHDSTYKMKAEWITYSSRNKTFEVDSFKVQPTLEKADYYKANNLQKTLFYVMFQKVRFTNLHFDRFIHDNLVEADSISFIRPEISIYNDRSVPPDLNSKVGNAPHQLLLGAGARIKVKTASFTDGKIDYTEKNEKTLKEGMVSFDGVSMKAFNLTNDAQLIRHNPLCNVFLEARMYGTSEVKMQFRFFLDQPEGKYEAIGSLKNIKANQLNMLALPLANVAIHSFNIQNIDFIVRGEDFEASSDLRMKYSDLSLTIKQTDEKTGITKNRKFLTKILNKFVVWPSNPGADGIERVATNARVSRLSSQSFFGMLWKAIFAGMQEVMVKTSQ